MNRQERQEKQRLLRASCVFELLISSRAQRAAIGFPLALLASLAVQTLVIECPGG
jgi:hypothetical protein